jgi:hypothetical protein
MTTIGQMPTTDFVDFDSFTAKLYPNTEVTVKFPDGTVKTGETAINWNDKSAPSVYNIFVRYNDKTTQQFTEADKGKNIKFKIGSVKAHYRGGKSRKRMRKSKRHSRKNKRSKTSRKRRNHKK